MFDWITVEYTIKMLFILSGGLLSSYLLWKEKRKKKKGSSFRYKKSSPLIWGGIVAILIAMIVSLWSETNGAQDAHRHKQELKAEVFRDSSNFEATVDRLADIADSLAKANTGIGSHADQLANTDTLIRTDFKTSISKLNHLSNGLSLTARQISDLMYPLDEVVIRLEFALELDSVTRAKPLISEIIKFQERAEVMRDYARAFTAYEVNGHHADPLGNSRFEQECPRILKAVQTMELHAYFGESSGSKTVDFSSTFVPDNRRVRLNMASYGFGKVLLMEIDFTCRGFFPEEGPKPILSDLSNRPLEVWISSTSGMFYFHKFNPQILRVDLSLIVGGGDGKAFVRMPFQPKMRMEPIGLILNWDDIGGVGGFSLKR